MSTVNIVETTSFCTDETSLLQYDCATIVMSGCLQWRVWVEILTVNSAHCLAVKCVDLMKCLLTVLTGGDRSRVLCNVRPLIDTNLELWQ